MSLGTDAKQQLVEAKPEEAKPETLPHHEDESAKLAGDPLETSKLLALATILGGSRDFLTTYSWASGPTYSLPISGHIRIPPDRSGVIRSVESMR